MSTAAVLCASAAFASSAPASTCVSKGCDMFKYGPKNGLFFNAPGGTQVKMLCWKDSTWWQTTNRWFHVSTIYGDGKAWVLADHVVKSTQTTVGRCP